MPPTAKGRPYRINPLCTQSLAPNLLNRGTHVESAGQREGEEDADGGGDDGDRRDIGDGDKGDFDADEGAVNFTQCSL